MMRINSRLFASAGLMFFSALMAHAQVAPNIAPNTPTSGAAVAISGTAGANAVNVLIYDSQIHSGVVGNVPLVPCTSADAVVATDAYVLQGGSATGCAPSDVYEITDVATSTNTFVARGDNSALQHSGATDISGFHIETHFVCVGKCAKNVTGTKTFCNTSGTICINVLNGNPADNGFIVVKNNTGSDFTGSIKLLGTSVSAACGGASDTSGNLPSGASVTLAMGNPGSTFDSSTCGGFNFDQMSLPMASPTQVTTFMFGADKFIVTPTNINTGDVLTFRPVPVPAGLFNLPGLTLSNGQQCVSISDFAAPTGANLVNPVCVEFQTHCLKNGVIGVDCSDAETFYWAGELDGRLDQNAGYPKDPVTGLAEIGGVHFLGAPGLNCLQKTFSDDIVLSYVGDQPADLPLKSGGSGLNCFAATFDPAQNPVAPGALVNAFAGFFSPIQPLPTVNPINSGQNVGLPFTFDNGAGGPGVPNLNWCPGGPTPGSPAVCLPTAAFPQQVSQPWVAFLRTPLSGCENTSPGSTGFIGNLPTNSFMHNYGGGSYKFNWATDPTEPTTNNCFSVGVVFSNGLSVPVVDDLAFVK